MSTCSRLEVIVMIPSKLIYLLTSRNEIIHLHPVPAEHPSSDPKIPMGILLVMSSSDSNICMWWFPKMMVPQVTHFNRVFHYKPSILGYPYFWKHPNRDGNIIPWISRLPLFQRSHDTPERSKPLSSTETKAPKEQQLLRRSE